MKALALAAMVASLSSATHPATFTPANTQSGIPATSRPEIVRVDCLIGSGTAFRVGPHQLLSVNHVTSLKGCFIDGKPFTVKSHIGDFSILTTKDAAPEWLDIDCGGFIANRHYIAEGFARGLDTLTDVDLTSTGKTDGQFSILSGIWTVVPGQSGGPIIDAQTGKVVGTVNVYDMPSGLSGSVALKGTPICSRA